MIVPRRRHEIAAAIITSISVNRYRSGKQLETELPFRHSHIYRELKAMVADGGLVMNGPCYYLNHGVPFLPATSRVPEAPVTERELPSEDVDLSELNVDQFDVEDHCDEHESVRRTKNARRLLERPFNGGQRVLIIPDAHFPFQSTDAWRLMMSAARWYCPDVLVVLGDFIDCYSVSSYPKSPGRLLSLKNEVDAANIG